jgi:uncharacterized protein (TIGR00288 family)
MATPYSRTPHFGGPGSLGAEAPHAALLIDFDNVTMGMRSDLSRELRNLLDSDVIKGKVSVQRAYADWRRYPQYIVPLSEASVDLIFAPAYGSSKKNATDIRMAIDAVELVFIRPEIGTYILLTGDSDFSSLVLKLKEYGKYVIGVGIQESSSDILVQNCDEYYSYTSLTGLRKTTETDHKPVDPWVLVGEAVKKMVARKDVMRSDRLKQVMQEMDTNFDEGSIGFSKFSRFLAEASSRGIVQLKKLENGQYEVGPSKGRRRGSESSERGGRSGRGRDRDRERRPARRGSEPPAAQAQAPADGSADEDPLQGAYDLLSRALTGLHEAGRESVRDSDVKRKMLEMDRSFHEAELGFPKFSKFLHQARDHGIVALTRTEQGNFEVRLAPEGSAPEHPSGEDAVATAETQDTDTDTGAPERDEAEAAEWSAPATETPAPSPSVVEFDPSQLGQGMLRLGPRRGTTRRRDGEPDPFFEGQILGAVEAPAAPAAEPDRTQQTEVEQVASSDTEPVATSSEGGFDAAALGLPTDSAAIGRYLTHRYKGVGEKTAESLVERFGSDLFRVMKEDPETIIRAVPGKRGEQVLEAWNSDYDRRSQRVSGGGGQGGGGRRGGRGRS